MNLRCYIVGDSVNLDFTVPIDSGNNVGDLKQSIKTAVSRFKGVDSYLLRLYQVNVPARNLEDELKQVNWNLPLNTTRKISDLFRDPDPEHVHVVVMPDNVVLCCLVLGDTPADIFNTRIPSNEDVAALKVRVKEEIPGRLPGDVTTFALYLADIPANTLAPDQPVQVGQPPNVLGQLLNGACEISAVFPIPRKNHIHVIVVPSERVTPRGMKRPSSPKLSAAERLKRSRLIEDSPSAFGAGYKVNQGNPEDRILDDRPTPDPDIAPIALLFSGFGRFEDIVAHREGTVGEERIRRRDFEEFADSMCEIYETEAERQKVALDKLNKMLVISRISASSVGRNRVSDGHCYCPGPDPIPNTVVEIKNELTGISSNPVAQLIAYIANLQVDMEQGHPDILNECRLPCLGITIVGPEVAFHAIISLASHYRVVTIARGSCVRSVSVPGGDQNSLYTAFVAASILQADIAAYFSRHIHLPRSIVPEHRFPAISKLKKDGTSTEYIKFTITASYPVLQINRYMYYADVLPSDTTSTTQGGDAKQILVKFSRTYGIDLHRFCFGKGHAPKILGFERLPGGWCGIAMEFLHHVQPITATTEVALNLRTLVEQFHAEGMVHGDLRATNILCHSTGFWIIDFDWGGKEGEAQYPTLDLNVQLREGRTSKDLRITRHDDLRVLDLTLQR